MNPGYITPRALARNLAILAIMPATFLAIVGVYTLGSVIILDRDQSVSSVTLDDSAKTVEARQFGPLFVTTAELEGGATVHCKNGGTLDLGYITGGWHIWRTIRAQGCDAGRR